ncbi:MAG TPA: ribonuclease P protein subunit [Candidatus Thalassarchaeaceae archaeon]|nr:ribonuclease P protein subunit [Candidatus Thalassarchaeaceae archaeon]
MEHWHTSWLSRRLTVVSSTDPTLVGRTGVVVDESRNMITISDEEGSSLLAKNTIDFTIDDSDTVVGNMVCQRPEDRVQKNYRRD